MSDFAPEERIPRVTEQSRVWAVQPGPGMQTVSSVAKGLEISGSGARQSGSNQFRDRLFDRRFAICIRDNNSETNRNKTRGLVC